MRRLGKAGRAALAVPVLGVLVTIATVVPRGDDAAPTGVAHTSASAATKTPTPDATGDATTGKASEAEPGPEGGKAVETREARVSTGEARDAAMADDPELKVTDPVPLLELRTAGNVGWMWTLSQREAEAAVERYGMTLRPGDLGHLRRQSFPGSQPVYRLRYTERSAYLLTASPEERDALVESGDFVDEGVLGYAAAEQRPGTAMLWRMSNGAEWRVVPDARKAEFEERGYATDGPLGYVWPEYTRVGAIYFATWDAQGNQGLLDNAERVYGRRDWWAGVRDFAGYDVERNAWHWADEDFSDLRPSIGYYDDSDPATLEKHIEQAAGAGLDHFAFYWYWNPADGGGENYVAGLKAFLQAGNRSKLDFTVMPCLHPWSDGPVSLGLPEDQIDKAARVLVDEYLAQPNFLRANDGRPVLTICDTRGVGDGTPDSNDVEAVRRFTDAIRERARETLGEEILITRNADLAIDDAAAGFDGVQCQGQWDPSRSYARYVDGQAAYFDRFDGVLIRCATSDFDERPRIGILIPDPEPPTQENLEAAFRWYDDQSLEEFRRLLGVVRQDIADSTRPPTVDNIVLLYAWNEWHEGGYIEPNTRDGCAYLDAVREEFGLTNGDGCVANPAAGTSGTDARR